MNVETINIAAVVFINMQSNSTVKLGKPKEQPYYYLNIIDAAENDLCLVHNGDAFGLVKVVRLIDRGEATILNKVIKPLLAMVKYDQPLLETAADKLKEYRETTTLARVQYQIDADLGRVHKTFALEDGEELVPPRSGKRYIAKSKAPWTAGPDEGDGDN